MVWYAWFDGAPNVNVRRFFSLLIKMILLSVVVYALSLLLIWNYYAFFPIYDIFFDSNTMVSIDELNVYWGLFCC